MPLSFPAQWLARVGGHPPSPLPQDLATRLAPLSALTQGPLVTKERKCWWFKGFSHSLGVTGGWWRNGFVLYGSRKQNLVHSQGCKEQLLVSMREEPCASTSKMPVEACWNPVARDARQACFAQNDVPLTRSLQAEVEKPAVRASKDGSLCWEGSWPENTNILLLIHYRPGTGVDCFRDLLRSLTETVRCDHILWYRWGNEGWISCPRLRS